MSTFVSRKEVLKRLGIHFNTLYTLVKKGEIEVLDLGSGYNKYNLDKYLSKKGINKEGKRKICYCRVSSQKQKEDLGRQIEEMKNNYPEHEIMSDIGSGLNFKRPNLNKIIEIAIKGELGELVISYKDRLARIGYELIEMIIEKYSKGKIIINNQTEEKTPEEEITKDIISIMNIYVAKINGLRKYKKKIKNTISKKIT